MIGDNWEGTPDYFMSVKDYQTIDQMVIWASSLDYRSSKEAVHYVINGAADQSFTHGHSSAYSQRPALHIKTSDILTWL